MDDRLLKTLQEFSQMYGNAILRLNSTKEDYKDFENVDKVDAVDNVFVLKKLEKYVEDLLKEVRRVSRYMQRVACLQATLDGTPRIDTKYCMAKATTKEMAKVPTKRRYDPESFDKLMKYLGVPEHLYMELKEDGSENELIRPHWPNVQERINRDLAAGKQVPVNKVENANEFEIKITRDKKVL